MSDTRLLFVAPTADLRGGGDLSLLELLRDGKKRGYYCHVALASRGPFSKKLREENIPHTITGHTLWHPTYKPSLFGKQNIRAIQSISRLIKQERINVVLSNTLQVPWGAVAAAGQNKPHVWMARETAEFGSAYLKDHFDFIQSHSNIVFANSEELANYLRKNNFLTSISIFRSFVDETKVSLGEATGTQRVVCVGNINPNKNQLLLIQALATLKKKGPFDIPVVFIGAYETKDPYFQKIQKYIKTHQLEKNISFLGFKRNPYLHMTEDDIFVQTSAAESMGRTTVEAMKLGLPCLGADIPGTRECFRLGGGHLYGLDAPGELAELISKAQEDPESFKRKARLSQGRALRNLSQHSCHDPLFKAIDGLGSSTNPRHDLRHIWPYVFGLSEESDRQAREIDHLKAHVSAIEGELTSIKNSKSWRYIRKLREVIGR